MQARVYYPRTGEKKLSYSLYKYGISHLINNGIEKCILEVIDQNVPAIKTYERIGFSITRKLINYIGKANCRDISPVDIKIRKRPDWNMVEEMCKWERSWQYNNHTLERGWKNYEMLTAGNGGITEAYCIVNLKNGRIANFGSKNGNTEYLYSLFKYLGEHIKNPVTIINVDESAVEPNIFLNSIGMQFFISSYEMEMDLPCTTKIKPGNK